jgi:hypothetical protein
VVWNNQVQETASGIGCPAATDVLSDGCTGLNAFMTGSIGGIAVDPAGNIYFSEVYLLPFMSSWQGVVRRIDSVTGIVTLYAGVGPVGHGGDGGAAISANLNFPTDLALDSSNNLYIVEYGAVRKVTPTGLISTVTGNGSPLLGYNTPGCGGGSGDGGPASAATFNQLSGVAVDAANDIYVVDTSACRVRRIESGTNTISNVAGWYIPGEILYGSNSPNKGDLGVSGSDGNANNAIIPQPVLVRLDGVGNMYIAEGGSAGVIGGGGVRKVNLSQSVMNFTQYFNSDYELDTVSPPMTTTVLNAGNGSMNFKTPFLSAPSWGIPSNWTRDVTNPTGSPDCYEAGAVNSGFECPVNVDFAPLSMGNNTTNMGYVMTGIATVNNSATNTPQAITLTGEAMALYNTPGGVADVSLLPSLLSFSTAEGIASQQQGLTLANNSYFPVTINTIALAPGAGSAVYTLNYSQCGTPPLTLARLSSCTILVTFNPSVVPAATASEFLNAQVVVTDSDPVSPIVTASLIGTGIPPSPPIPLAMGDAIHVTDTPGVQVVPIIIWPAPAPIVYGYNLDGSLNKTDLSGVLNAVATSGTTVLPGTPTYTATPAAGGTPVVVTAATELNVGNYTLTVSFAPTDAIDYATAMASVSLSVSQYQYLYFTDNLPATANYSNGLTYTISAAVGSLPGNGSPITYTFTGPATLVGNTLTITGIGLVTVTANQAGGNGYAAASVSQTITIYPTSQTITFTDGLPTSAPFSGQSYTLSATGGGSGNPVTFTATGPQTLVGNTLTITGVGTVTVYANQAGNINFQAAPQVSQSITVNPAQLTVTANSTSRAVGAANPTFTASYSGFVNGDTSAVLGGAPSLTTTATTSSVAGTYPITAAVGTLTAANYTFVFVNGTLSVVASPTVILTTTATLTGSASTGYTATITVTNSGTGAASNVTLTSATLGTVAGSPLPQTLPSATIAAGKSGVFTVSFSGSAGQDGAGVAEKYAGTYTGGSFSASVRSVTLP